MCKRILRSSTVALFFPEFSCRIELTKPFPPERVIPCLFPRGSSLVLIGKNLIASRLIAFAIRRVSGILHPFRLKKPGVGGVKSEI